MEIRKIGTYQSENNDLIENLKKKRPNLTRLDIQKLFEQSVQLTQIHRKLADENKRLKKDFQKVEQAKTQRQQFISQVQKIVKQKSHQLSNKNPHQSSWLVFKLQQKIFNLKQQIQVKDKAIRKLNLSKQNQILFKKQIEVECLRQINQFAQEVGIINQDADQHPDEELQEIVWMDDFLYSEKQRIEELESQLQQEERETKRLLTAIGVKKAEIKRMRQIEKQYFTVQQSFIQQKKKKEEKTVDNRSFLTNLMKQRDQQTEKLQLLKQKKEKIEAQQLQSIKKLEERLSFLKKFYDENKGSISNTKQKSDICIKAQSKEQWVKRVSMSQVQAIAKNLNHCLALRGVDQEKWITQFFKDQKQTYSIQNIINKLGVYPFSISNQKQKTLLARYVVQDNDTGLMLEDLNTNQDAPIIKSILIKLIGPIKVYTLEQMSTMREELGAKLSKYWSLVEQSVHIKEGVRNLITREILLQGINEAELDLTQEERNFAILYLFSWSKDINKLQLNKLGKLKELGINSNFDK